MLLWGSCLWNSVTVRLSRLAQTLQFIALNAGLAGFLYHPALFRFNLGLQCV